MGEWHEFARLRHFSASYRTILVGTFLLTVVFDLTVAVQVGLVLACVFFIYRMGTLFRIEPNGVPVDGVVVYRLYGALFFGAVAKMEAASESVPAGARTVILEMHRLVLMDTSGLDALAQLQRSLARAGVRLVLCDLNEQPRSLIQRSGFEAEIGAHSIQPDLPAALRSAAG
jgi:SulP family sulfate permease